MPPGADIEPWPPPGRREEIDTRLDAVRARLQELRERDPGGVRGRAVGERVESARHHAAEAHAAAVEVLASAVEAFRHAAQAHERAASVHERAGAKGIGDLHEHEQRAALHRAAAAADWRRAERAQSLLAGSARARSFRRMAAHDGIDLRGTP